MYPTPFPELLLGRLIGRGSYGRVHLGVFRGREVAIKARARPAPAACGACPMQTRLGTLCGSEVAVKARLNLRLHLALVA